MNRGYLVDINSGDVFSEMYGWNKSEISIRCDEDWAYLIYKFSDENLTPPDKINPKGWNWENRRIYFVPICIPQEQKQLC